MRTGRHRTGHVVPTRNKNVFDRTRRRDRLLPRRRADRLQPAGTDSGRGLRRREEPDQIAREVLVPATRYHAGLVDRDLLHRVRDRSEQSDSGHRLEFTNLLETEIGLALEKFALPDLSTFPRKEF